MSSPKRFGHYLVFKKLAHDPLGDSFRAGKIADDKIEQMVLLRLFNGEAVSGDRLWQSLSDGGLIQKTPESPQVGRSLEVGRLGGTVYAAYSYASGATLKATMERAREKLSPVPTDLALMILERVTMGLAAAAKAKIHHGFLLPQLVGISHEGQVRVLGFEVARALRAALVPGGMRQSMDPYLPPEALAGDAPDPADDVFSLGALGFELLTGEALPQVPGGDYAPVLAAAKLAGEGGPMPEELASLLGESLAPKERRIGDVVTWHKRLGRLMTEGQYSPRVFNLAFFVYNLFRKDIELENQEIEAEKTTPVPPPGAPGVTGEAAHGAAAPPLAPTPAATQRIPPAAVEGATPPPPKPEGVEQDDTTAVRARYGIEDASEPKKTNWAVIAAAAGVLVVAGAVFAYLRFSGAPEPEAPAAVDQAQMATQAVELPEVAGEGLPEEAPPEEALPEGEALPEAGAVEGEPAPPEVDALEARVQQLVQEAAKQTETNLRKQYEEQIRALQAELEAARLAAQQRETVDVQEPVATTPPPTTETTRVAAGGQPEGAAQGGQSGSGARQPVATSSTALQQARQEVLGDQASATTETPPSTTPPAQKTTQRTTPIQTAPRRPVAHRGDLVQPGPDVTPPKLQRRPQPRFPPLARRLNRHATIVVRCLVDENGRVIQTELRGEKAGYGFDQAALEAARETTWVPAEKDGVKVRMWVDLRIDFKL